MKIAMSKRIAKNFFYAVCLLSFAVVPIKSAHRFHTSLTRIEFNSEQKLFEISIQIFTHDLVPLLERRSGKRIELDKSPEVDKIILDYLNEHFVLSDKQGAAKKMKWIGRESDVDSMRIYLETASTENPENYQLKNTIFFESFPEQTNLVICRYDGEKADLMFKVGDKVKEIAANKKMPK